MSPPEDLEKLRQDLRQQIISELSHDLRTPLATIIGSLEIYNFLDNRITKEKRSALVKSALMEAHRLNNFIKDMSEMRKNAL